MPCPSTENRPWRPESAADVSATRVVAGVLFCVLTAVLFHKVPPAARWPLRGVWLLAAGWLAWAALGWLRGVRFTVKKTAFTLVLGLLLYGAVSLVCHMFIRLMSVRDDRLTTRSFTHLSEPCRTGIRDMLDGRSYNLFDKTVGWVPRPGFHSELYTISAQGLRGAREYPLTPPDPERRVLCMGDSFTFGFAVNDEGAYPHHAEQLRPGTEWLNFGISGTCLAQSLLHYRRTAKKFGGRHVVIGFMTNDAPRTVNCFRPFVSPLDAGHPFTKPFARFSGGTFSLEPNPYQETAAFERLLADEPPEIEKLRGIDYLTWSRQQTATNPILRTAGYVREALHLDRNLDLMLARRVSRKKEEKRTATADPYGRDIWNPASPGFQAIAHLFDVYHDEVVADGREPLIVIIPGPLDVEDFSNHQPRQYAALLEHFKKKGWRHLDFLDVLVAGRGGDLARERLFYQLHYTSVVNRELAGAIVEATGIR